MACDRFLEGGRVLYAAPYADQLNQFWFEITRAFSKLIDAKVVSKNETENYIEFPRSKQRIKGKTAYSADAIRGDYGDLIILDEYQLMNEDVLQLVVFPMLMDHNGDLIIGYTPPRLAGSDSQRISKARDPNHARVLYGMAQAEMESAIAEGREMRWFASTWTSYDNPWISGEGIGEVSRDMSGVNYRREIMAEEVTDEDLPLRDEWLRYYNYRQSEPDKPLDDPTNFLQIAYEKHEGEPQIEPIFAGSLDLRMIVDPNHAGKHGRCKHAVTVTGFDPERLRFHLLDEWAESCGYRDFADNTFKMADKWGLSEVWMETVASQVYCKLYFEELNKQRKRQIRFKDLPKSTGKDAKDRRIESLEPYFRNAQFFVHRAHKQFMFEYRSYYRGKNVDVDTLDTLGYAPQLYRVIRTRDVLKAMQDRAHEFSRRTVVATGY